MKKDFLKYVSKKNKADFLAKLQSGKYTLGEVYEPAQPLQFELQESGLYKCVENGKELTLQEIEALPGYRMRIEFVENPLQVSGERPVYEFRMCPFMENEYLDSLLINKNEDDLHVKKSGV